MKKFRTKEDKFKENINIVKGLTMLTQLGIMMVSTILIGIGMGIGLDKLLKTNIVFTSIFSFLAVGAAFRNMYMYLQKK